MNPVNPSIKVDRMDRSTDWAPGRRWRVTTVVNGTREVWCETSDESEAQQHLSNIPDDATEPLLEQLWERHESEWRSVEMPLPRIWTQKIEVAYVPDCPVPGECWLWRGAVDYLGYGRLKVDRKTQGIHRVVYERLVGPIPDGMVIDHRCGQTSCCAPHHLEPVRPEENTSRARRRGNSAKTHCPQGHEFDGLDETWLASRRWFCSQCGREYQRPIAHRKKRKPKPRVR